MYHLAWSDTSRGDLADDTFEVTYLGERVSQRLAGFGVLEEVFDHCLSIAYCPHLFERESHPTMEESSTHRSDRAVDDVVQRFTLFGLAVVEFEVLDGEAVEPDIFIFFDTAEVLDMSGLEVLRHIEVHEDTSCGGDTCRHFLEAESFEG